MNDHLNYRTTKPDAQWDSKQENMSSTQINMIILIYTIKKAIEIYDIFIFNIYLILSGDALKI